MHISNNMNHIVEYRYTLVVLLRCPECGANTELAASYYNAKIRRLGAVDVRAKLIVTLKNGKIKKIETKGPGIG